MSNERVSIFISWSKKHSGEIALAMKEWLNENIAHLDVFISHEVGFGDDWKRVIDGELAKAEMGLLILTQENINSSWVLFESGAIYKTGRLFPFLCGRSKNNIEGPFQGINHAEFSEEGLVNLLLEINKRLNLSLTTKNINSIVSSTWSDLSGKIIPLIESSKIYIPTPEESGLETRDQDDFDLMSKKIFSVQNQDEISAENIFGDCETTAGDIPGLFKVYLDSQIPKKYKKLDKQKDGSFQTRVMINNTRISNFVSFTDGKRIALYDRDAANMQQVENSSYDVFGAVTFENNSLFMKIKNENFKDVVLKSIDEVPGFAFEDNVNKYLETETVIMFGYSALVAPEDLDLITLNSDSTIKLWPVRLDVPKNTTAKARLAFQFSKSKYLKY